MVVIMGKEVEPMFASRGVVILGFEIIRVEQQHRREK